MKYLYPNLPNWLDPESARGFDKKTDWIAERKKNGWRCLAIRTETGLELWTRRHTIIHDPLPMTRSALGELPPLTVIDGELIDKRSKDIKDHYYAFDILFAAGKQLTGMSWTLRRKILEEVMKYIPVEISEPIIPGKYLLYETAIADGDEGIVMKCINSKYLVDYGSCPKNPYWMKCKKAEDSFGGSK
jgi:ATP-dependent DNA ligase